MIKSISLENFFSFSKAYTISLNEKVNVLVGINGSGKSNFLKAITFLYESIAGGGLEKIFLKDWGGFNTVANFNEFLSNSIKIIYEFDAAAINMIAEGDVLFSGDVFYEVIIHKSGVTSYFLEESLYSTSGESPVQVQHYLNVKNGKGTILTIDANNAHSGYAQEYSSGQFKEQELVLRQISDPNRFRHLHVLRAAIENIAVYDGFDTSMNGKIRQKSFGGIETRLLYSGENLIQLLSRIKNNHALDYENIEENLKRVNPNFKDIGFDQLGNNLYLTLREKMLAKTVGIGQISDGTLRYLLLLSIFQNPERGYIVGIDEPETGLHPDMISTIADAIKATSTKTQVFIATHSPQLLNSFELDDLLIFEKDDNNRTIVIRKTEEDFEDWNDNYLLGQLWLRGKLGGKRW